MIATERMKKIAIEELGVLPDGELSLENLFKRDLAMGKVIDELEEKILFLERRLIALENK